MARFRLRALLEWRGDPRQLLRSRRRTVKVHGLLRTGTNYVSALLGENFFVYLLGPEKGGWKHGPIDEATDALVAVVVKSPYTWLESFYNWELLRGRTTARTLTEFASAPVSHPQLAAAWNARDPVDAWNKATASWVEAQRTRDVLVIRYEDVLGDLAGELDRFGQRFSTTRRHRVPVDITARVGPGVNTVGPVDRGRYAPGAGGTIDDTLVELLRARVDPDLATLLRYGPEE